MVTSYLKLLPVVITLTVGCGNSSAGSKADKHPIFDQDPGQIVELTQEYNFQWCSVYEQKSDGFHCVRKACENAGAHWNETTKECKCTEGLFSAWDGGSCEAIKSAVSRKTSESDFVFQIETKHSNFSIRLDSLNRTKENLKWIKAKQLNYRKNLPRTASFAIGNGRWNQAFVLGSDGSRFDTYELLGTLSMSEYLNEPSVGINPTAEFGSLPVSYYVAEISDFEALLYGTVPTPSQLDIAPTSPSTFVNMMKVYRSTGQASPDRIDSLTVNGCAGSCMTTQTLALDNVQERVTLSEKFAGGTRYFSEIKTRKMKADSIEEYSIRLLPNKIPSLLTYTRTRYDASSVRTKIHIRDRFGRTLADPQESVGKIDRSKESLEIASSIPGFDPNHEATIMTCEAAYDPSLIGKNRILQNLIKGPSASFFGWTEVDSRDPSTFYSDRISSFDRNSFVQMDQYNHSLRVLKSAASVVPKIRIVPNTWMSCFENKAYVNLPRVLVASVSILTEMDRESCQKSILGQAILQSHERRLWVVGAGNDSKEYRSGDSSLDCPSNLSGQDNVLIVAASDNNGVIRDFSNSGAKFADVAVSETSGTSFAAPKVAAIAATISKLYKFLTPAEIRLLLILGSQVSGSFNSTRSGGVIDLDGSKQIAMTYSNLIDEKGDEFRNRFIRKDRSALQETLKANFSCYFDCSEITERLNWLNKYL